MTIVFGIIGIVALIVTIVFVIIGIVALIVTIVGFTIDNTPLAAASLVIGAVIGSVTGVQYGINSDKELCNEAYAVKNLSPESYECYILEDENRESIVELRNKHKEKDRKVRVVE